MNNPSQRFRERESIQALGWKVYANLACNPLEERWNAFLVRGEQGILARAPEPYTIGQM